MTKNPSSKVEKHITKTVSEVMREEAFVSVWVDRSPIAGQTKWVISLDGYHYKQLETLPFQEDPQANHGVKARAIEIGREKDMRVYFYETDYRVLLYDPANLQLVH
jgi:hypothetical protein